MLTAAARFPARVTCVTLQVDTLHGGRLVCKTDIGDVKFAVLDKIQFQLIAESLRPPAEFNSREFDYTDAGRVAKWLKGKLVTVRRERHDYPELFWFHDAVIGVRDDVES